MIDPVNKLFLFKLTSKDGGITFETQIAPGAEQYPAFGNIHLAAHTPFETTTEFKIDTREGI